LKIALHVFSGRPTPVWTLNPGDAGYDVIIQEINTRESTDLPSILGYAGFTVVTNSGDNVYTFTAIIIPSFAIVYLLKDKTPVRCYLGVSYTPGALCIRLILLV